MLEHVPHWLGALLHDVRAGHSKLVIVQDGFAGDAELDLRSPAFGNGARLPERFTADGAGVSPPLVWGDVPAGTAGLALIVEDADAPSPQPLVHAILWDLPADERTIAEGAIRADGDGAPDGRDVGRNSYLREGWLPPDPPTGHGSHDYVFQLFALSQVPDIGATPGRSEFVEAIRGRVLAAGMLVGTYSRGERLMTGTDAPMVPAM
ncbi:phosphatidylethanolamine-binding protein [Sphingomonas sp. Leaf412]|uniref:YbhB/YbcL family Raf kinase inhibitor-like protein n=1 Tax=Sphingomonas sp. Leaf412 TaxID=1736370 RepID=UPI0007004C1F|nr:YbhB/YbcL family Raf kinase inhibitor-like protein [Sphingomonas sp. Leaf412]KQT33406.1 phosphatidylethanolamine-binding protein [Sphingomonas sp. Leaf412]